MFDPKEHSHRRHNILTGEWIQVSPHRSKRPWQGKVETINLERRPKHDPDCYLCAGNNRAGGKTNPDYKGAYVFTNDFASLQSDIPEGGAQDGLLNSKSERGICKVICFSPRHDLTVAEMEVEDIKKVVDLWIDQCNELGGHDFINHIQIFENKGEIMGCSNPHPHGQIWSQESIPVEPTKKQHHQLEYWRKKQQSLLGRYLAQELESKERILYENNSFVVLVPFWAIWPYETMIIPKRHMSRIVDLTDEERSDFAKAYKHITVKYDNLFETSFPYSAGIHQAPYDGEDHKEWHWHMSFYPPLLRSATVKKFMVGYEMFANGQRDITAEYAAEKLRSLPDIRFGEE